MPTATPSEPAPIATSAVGRVRSGVRPSGTRTLGISLVAWSPKAPEMNRSDWIAAGHRLGSISRCNQWWLGDWARYGTARWGEKYSAAARITGYDPRSLANMASIASAFPPSRRRDNLTWSHHAAVAALDDREQDQWLDLAVAHRLSVADLRTELRAASRVRATHPTREACGAPMVVCPQCRHHFNLAAARADAAHGP